MTVPIQISWDMYLGQATVWCECLAAGARRAVLLPRLDAIFSPREEDPARELPYRSLDWRLVSPTESDWDRYRNLVEKQAARYRMRHRAQRVESLAQWVAGRPVSLPQYHLWLFADPAVGETIDRLYDELDPDERRGLWRWLLAWTTPAQTFQPYDPR